MSDKEISVFNSKEIKLMAVPVSNRNLANLWLFSVTHFGDIREYMLCSWCYRGELISRCI